MRRLVVLRATENIEMGAADRPSRSQVKSSILVVYIAEQRCGCPGGRPQTDFSQSHCGRQ